MSSSPCFLLPSFIHWNNCLFSFFFFFKEASVALPPRRKKGWNTRTVVIWDTCAPGIPCEMCDWKQKKKTNKCVWSTEGEKKREIRLAEKCVTLIIPQLKSQHYIVLIQVTISKNKKITNVIFFPFRVTEIRLDRYWYTYTETGVRTIAYLHTHRWAFMFSFTHFCAHTCTHIQQTSRHFPASDHRCQSSL